MNLTRLHATLTAWTAGIRNGFQQPHDAASTPNVEHLLDVAPNAQESLDAGITLGQYLRAGTRSQSHAEGYRHVLPTY